MEFRHTSHHRDLERIRRMRITREMAFKSKSPPPSPPPPPPPPTSIRGNFLGMLKAFNRRVRNIHHDLKRIVRFGRPAPISFDTLPSDVIVNILFQFDSFSNLYTFISSSSTCYRLFNQYSTSILTNTAKNILGDAWEDAAEVLVWQRNSKGLLPDYPAVLKDFKFKFVLQRQDIPQLIANQRFFKSCEENFKIFTKLSYPRTLTFGKTRTPCFSTGVELEPRIFYLMWLLHLRFRYESVEAFAKRPCFTVDEYIDHYLVSRIMYRNKLFKQFIYSPDCWDTWEKVLSRNLFSVWLKAPANKKVDTNPLLKQKMICHLIATAAGGMQIPVNGMEMWRTEFRDVFEMFMRDYMVKDVMTLVREYRLTEGE